MAEVMPCVREGECFSSEFGECFSSEFGRVLFKRVRRVLFKRVRESAFQASSESAFQASSGECFSSLYKLKISVFTNKKAVTDAKDPYLIMKNKFCKESDSLPCITW